MAVTYLSAAEAADLIRATDSLAIPLGPGQPGAFLHALDARDSFDELTIFGALLVDLYGVFMKPGVKHLSGFFGPAERFLRDSGADIEFVPADFRRFGPLMQALSPRVMTTNATMPDARGYLSLSLHAGASVDELHRAGADPDRLLIVEANANLPYTIGLPPVHGHRLHIDEIDVIVESEQPLFILDEVEPTDTERAIAVSASTFISDGCTLQTGIGGIPSTVARLIAEGDGGDYGIHSEMFTTGLMRLHEAGKVTNHKGVYDGISASTFAAGTAELYEWLDHNDAVRFLPVDYINSPDIISRNRKMVTINGALAIDLSGQVTADTIAGKQFSGIGGHEDFVSGAGIELEDRSLVCFPATATVKGERVSRIVPQFAAGSVVTTPRHQLDVVITEYGAAELQGKTVRQRAVALAEIAHPDFRDDLLANATEWPID